MLGHRILGKFENVLTPPPLAFGTFFQTKFLYIKILYSKATFILLSESLLCHDRDTSEFNFV